MNYIEEKLKEFEKGHNSMNISDPANDTEWVKHFLRSALVGLVEEIRTKALKKTHEDTHRSANWKLEVEEEVIHTEDLLALLDNLLSGNNTKE